MAIDPADLKPPGPPGPTVSGLAKVGDPITHDKGSAIITGDSTVLICDKPAARLIVDRVACPRRHSSSHGGTFIRGPKGEFSRNVFIGAGRDMAAMIGDECFPCDNCSTCEPGIVCPSGDTYKTSGGTVFPPPPPALDVDNLIEEGKGELLAEAEGKVTESKDKAKDKLVDAIKDKLG